MPFICIEGAFLILTLSGSEPLFQRDLLLLQGVVVSEARLACLVLLIELEDLVSGGYLSLDQQVIGLQESVEQLVGVVGGVSIGVQKVLDVHLVLPFLLPFLDRLEVLPRDWPVLEVREVQHGVSFIRPGLDFKHKQALQVLLICLLLDVV